MKKKNTNKIRSTKMRAYEDVVVFLYRTAPPIPVPTSFQRDKPARAATTGPLRDATCPVECDYVATSIV